MRGWGAIAVVVALMLSACADKSARKASRWDHYYANVETPSAHVQVVPPDGTTVPMSKLIADYVVDYLKKEKISAQLSGRTPPPGPHFVLSGTADVNAAGATARHARVMRWLLADAEGRVIGTYTHGIEGTEHAWNNGDAQLLNSIGVSAAGPVAQMIKRETLVKTHVEPLQRGLLVDRVTGLNAEDGAYLRQAVAKALRTTDVFVTGDPRQAAFRLAGHVEILPGGDGFDDVRIVWRVLTMDRQELGNAVQENRVPSGSLTGRWAEVSGRIGQAAAVGVEHVFGTRIGPPPGARDYPGDQPPAIVLPGQPGRAMPPPQ